MWENVTLMCCMITFLQLHGDHVECGDGGKKLCQEAFDVTPMLYI